MSHHIKRLSKDLWAIEDTLTTEHAIWYILNGTKYTLVFDSGLGSDSILPILQKIAKKPVMMVLSHPHFDHIGGAHEVDNIYAWKSDCLVEASTKGVPNEVIRTQASDKFWKVVPNDFSIRPLPHIKYLNDINAIEIGNYSLEVIYTPGHCEGSVCLYERNMKWLFSGDLIYDGPIYLHFNDSDSQQYEDSINKLLKLDIEQIFPGHNSTPIGQSIIPEIHGRLTGVSIPTRHHKQLSIKYR